MPPAPPHIVDIVDRVMRGFKKRIENYLSAFNDKVNRDYFPYFLQFNPGSEELIKLVIQYPLEKNKYVDVPYEMKVQTSAVVQFGNLLFDNLIVHFEFPPILLGPKGAVPQIVFRAKAPIAYPGNIGLVWEAISGDMGKYAFHPFGSKATAQKDLMEYYKDGIVDQLCNTINSEDPKKFPMLTPFRKFMDDMILGNLKKYFRYEPDPLSPTNFIQFPIMCEYNEGANMMSIFVRTWAVGDDWIPPAEIVLGVIQPLCALIALFNEQGELRDKQEVEKDKEMRALSGKGDRRVFLSSKERTKDRVQFDPFKAQQKKVERDEFGFIISRGPGKESFSVQETAAARNKLTDLTQIPRSKEKAAPRDTSHVKKYPSADKWFEENASKSFIVKGDTNGLSFIDKSNVDLVKSMSPPFMLRFARDQIKVRRGVTSIKAVEILFSVYNLGFLYEA